MKKMMLGLLFLSTTALAGEVLVKEYSEYELAGMGGISSQFEVNEELGRAWVKVSFSGIGEEMGGDERVKVEGLSYDSTTATINFEHDGAQIDCAKLKVRGRGIFRTVTVRETGKCDFVQRWRHGSYDNGFEIVKYSKLQLLLNVE